MSAARALQAMEAVLSEGDDVLQKLSASQLICEVLVNFGVTHIFGGHGGAIVGLIDAIEAHPKLTWVYMRCEVNAAMAAMAYAKFNNRLGVCVATSGPGAGHLLSGLVDADQDRVPLLCITGLKDAKSIRHADFQDIDQASIFRIAGLSFSEAAGEIHQLIPLLRNALYTATSTNRCAHLAVPIDVQLGTVTAPKHLNFRDENRTGAKKFLGRASAEQIEGLASALLKERMQRKHMVIFCGWRAGACVLGDAVEELARFLEVPVITSFDGKGTVDETDDNSFGVAGMYGFVGGGKSQSVLEKCDVVVSVCLPDLSKAVADKSDMQVRRLIQIETSLVAGDTLRYLAVHSFECLELSTSLGQVVQAMARKKEVMKLSFDNSLKRRGRKTRLSTLPTDLHTEEDGYCHPGIFFSNMTHALKDDAVLCADIGDNALWMASGIAAKKGQRTLTSEHMGIMGFALNAGLASSLSLKSGKERQVLVVAGDGGFQMSSNELATLKDHGVKNVLVVIIVNGRLGRVNNETWGPGVRADGCTIGSPDYIKLFDAHGYPNGKLLTTSDDEKISNAIENGWELASKQGVALLVVNQDPFTHPTMHKTTKVTGEIAWQRYLKSMNEEHSPTRTSFANEIDVNNNKLLPFHFSEQTLDKLDSLQSWVESHDKAQSSSYTWVGGDFLSISPAEVFQHQLSEMMGEDNVPDIFATQEEKEIFDQEFWENLMKSFSVEELSEIFHKGSSNGHPLRLQILVLPKDTFYKLHAHPNSELIIAMQGTLYENYLTNFAYPKSKLERLLPSWSSFPTEESINELMETYETCVVIEDQGDRSQFVDRVCASQGRGCANPIGSVHQSFSGKESGALLFVLWSGCHANIQYPDNVKHKRGANILRGGGV